MDTATVLSIAPMLAEPRASTLSLLAPPALE
jgi:hypothetical protein